MERKKLTNERGKRWKDSWVETKKGRYRDKRQMNVVERNWRNRET